MNEENIENISNTDMLLSIGALLVDLSRVSEGLHIRNLTDEAKMIDIVIGNLTNRMDGTK